jgi:hypothetical protein
MPNDETVRQREFPASSFFRHSSFVLRHSNLVIRISSFHPMIQDLRLAFRSLINTPGFTLPAATVMDTSFAPIKPV